MDSSLHFAQFGATFVCFVLLLLAQSQAQPSPGFHPSSQVAPLSFYQGFRNLWGPQHMSLQQDTLTVWLDRSSGNALLLFLLFQIYYDFEPNIYWPINLKLLSTSSILCYYQVFIKYWCVSLYES